MSLWVSHHKEHYGTYPCLVTTMKIPCSRIVSYPGHRRSFLSGPPVVIHSWEIGARLKEMCQTNPKRFCFQPVFNRHIVFILYYQLISRAEHEPH